jgi:hypothetical protein
MYVFAVVAAAAACCFTVEAVRHPRPGVIVAAIVWLLYAAYEVLIANGTLCDANCNIRVDLLLLWPLVWLAALFGIYASGQWPAAAKLLGKVIVFFVASMAALSVYMAFVETPAADRPPPAKSSNETTGKQ